jgi:hypothetical protein
VGVAWAANASCCCERTAVRPAFRRLRAAAGACVATARRALARIEDREAPAPVEDKPAAMSAQNEIVQLAANAAALDAAEGRSQVADAEAVDPDETCAHALSDCGGMPGLAVAHAAQAVVGAVGQLQRLLVVGKGLQRQHRAEDLVLDDLVILLHAAEHRRLDILRAKGVLAAAP